LRGAKEVHVRVGVAPAVRRVAILPDREGIKFSLGPIRVLSGRAVWRPE